jgi:methionyl-tRNA formyltransferase
VKALRIVFMGTPDFAAVALRHILASRHSVIAAYSQPPRPKGRGQAVQASPVHALAEAKGIPVHTPSRLKKNPDAVAAFAALQADIAVVAAYGLILPQDVLDAPRHGCLNIHASLLPRWRGASPIQHAILHGDATSGVTIMQMEAGLDTGPMIAKRETEISGMTASALHDALADIGGALIVETLDRLAAEGSLASEAQDDALSCYAPMLKKEDGRIDWRGSAERVDAQVRALNPWPGTFGIVDGRRLKILAGEAGAPVDAPPGQVFENGIVACGAGSFRLRTVQPENGRAMDIAAALNGKHLRAGDVFET